MAKIDIISGFLGAGKTTLIKKLIAEALQGEQLVLIENEFGEIGIDGGFLKDSGINITEMNSGCICCSLVGDFGTALKEVLTTYHPDRIIIEPSGVGKLSDVIKAVEGVKHETEEIVLNSFVAVVDAGKSKMYMKNFGEFFNNQMEYANTIILSRTQNLTEDKLNTVVSAIREHNEKAILITTPWEELDGKKILSAMEHGDELVKELLEEEEVCPVCGHHHHHEGEHHHDEKEHHHHEGEHHHEEHDHHHADEVFTSWGAESPRKYEKEELTSILVNLADNDKYGMVLRAKGIVPSKENVWFHFDLTPGEYEIREGVADYTGRICVIGSKLKEEELKKLFQV